jgi:hypothetical protein
MWVSLALRKTNMSFAFFLDRKPLLDIAAKHWNLRHNFPRVNHALLCSFYLHPFSASKPKEARRIRHVAVCCSSFPLY